MTHTEAQLNVITTSFVKDGSITEFAQNYAAPYSAYLLEEAFYPNLTAFRGSPLHL